jgi:hypothetical protein
VQPSSAPGLGRALLIFTASCNLLLGNAEPLGGHAANDGGSDGPLAEVGSPRPDADTPTPLPDGDISPDAAPLPDADVSPDSAVACPDSCPRGDCVLSACAARVVGHLGRLIDAFADPGTSGSVFFSGFDSNIIYGYDKSTTSVSEYPSPMSVGVGPVANAATVFWAIPLSGSVGWASRDGTTSGYLAGVSYGEAWNNPCSTAVDTGYLYWSDCNVAHVWRIDLGFESPALLYEQVAPDAGPTPDPFAGNIAVDPGPDGFVFVVARDRLNRFKKDGSELTVIAPALAAGRIGVHGGYVYWLDPTGAMLRAPEDIVAPCDAGGCGQVVVPAGLPSFAGAQAFDDTYVYWVWMQSNEFTTARLARARQDGSSPDFELVAEHTSMTSVAVDDAAVYYTTNNDQGLNQTGSLWRLQK